jgi:hypothetical protein
MPHTTFHHLLEDFTKSVGLDIEIPSAENLESFEFTHEGTRCVVRPAGDATHVIIDADVLRLDTLPIIRRSQALRLLHGVNLAAHATNHLVVMLDVDEEIRISKNLLLSGLTASALADEMVSAIEAAQSLARSLQILGRAEEAPAGETAPAPAVPCPLQIA